MLRAGVLPLITALSAGAMAEGWRMPEFMISGWGAPTDEATARAFESAGFNTVMCKVEQLELCRAHGLKAILFDATPEFAAQHQGDEAIWGYYVQDEPKAEEFAAAGARVAAFEAADPTHPGYVNLMAWMDLKQYFATVKPRFLSYDYYQWWWGEKNHFGRLAAHRQAALEAGVPLICWVEANADKRYERGEAGAGYLPDNAAKLRQSVFTALAYGVKGIQWFTTGLVFGKDGALTESGADIARINADVNALGPILVRLRSTNVWHTGPVPEGAQALPGDGRIATKTGELVIGEFVEDGTGAQYLMVVNESIEKPKWVVLALSGVAGPVEVFHREARKWSAVSAPDGDGRANVEFILQAGDGVLMRVRWKQ
ncbi:MAG: hypothetical protein FJX75_05285 [Armatimonadetes bacterium]|nr:hypothetical protein [Armatimonadota bacterium]